MWPGNYEAGKINGVGKYTYKAGETLLMQWNAEVTHNSLTLSLHLFPLLPSLRLQATCMR